jgi:hypothetical protein
MAVNMYYDFDSNIGCYIRSIEIYVDIDLSNKSLIKFNYEIYSSFNNFISSIIFDDINTKSRFDFKDIECLEILKQFLELESNYIHDTELNEKYEKFIMDNNELKYIYMKRKLC